MTFNDYFDNIFCINLDRRTDRWSDVLTEFSRVGISGVTRFSAVDGTLLNDKTHLLPGELGVLMTNLNLVNHAKEMGYQSYLMCEDDVVFGDTIKNLETYMANIPNDWDMIYFGGNHGYSTKPKLVNETTLKLHHTVAIHCVAIKSTVYDVIISILQKKNKQVDDLYTLVQKSFNVYCVTPHIAFQKEGYSDIQNRLVNYDRMLK